MVDRRRIFKTDCGVRDWKFVLSDH